MTRTATSRRRLLIAAGAAATMISGLASPAVASVDSGQAQAADARSRHQQVVDYWTAERRASATPREVVLAGGPAQPNAGKKPGGGAGGGTTTSPVTGATWTGTTGVGATTGKVFFNVGSSRYVCSGSLVDSDHGNLVLTAGHCVHDGAGAGFVTNWIFYPGYAGSEANAPYGAWTATSLFTTSTWAGTANGYDDDAGFAVVTGGSGAGTLEAELSGHGLPTVAFDTSHTGVFTSLGYPAAGRKYNGQVLTYCQGTVSPDRDANDTLAMSCDMTGGSSGGPWFSDLANGTVIRSLNSYGYSSLRNVMFGPIFGTGERAAYSAAAEGLGTCDSTEVCVSFGN